MYVLCLHLLCFSFWEPHISVEGAADTFSAAPIVFSFSIELWYVQNHKQSCHSPQLIIWSNMMFSVSYLNKADTVCGLKCHRSFRNWFLCWLFLLLLLFCVVVVVTVFQYCSRKTHPKPWANGQRLIFFSLCFTEFRERIWSHAKVLVTRAHFLTAVYTSYTLVYMSVYTSRSS